MKYTSQEIKLIDKIQHAILDVTPGVCARAYHLGRLVCDISVGLTYPYYDLASLTKVIFTQQAMMQAFDLGLWNMESKAKDFLPDLKHEHITIKQLMTHTSGLQWWLPLYQTIDLNKTWKDKRLWIFQQINKSTISTECINTQSVYSDLGAILLGFILEKIYQKDLYEVWNDIKQKYYPSTTFDFHINNQTDLPPRQFAPTEECPWRKRILRAEVHDENCWSFGGISSHAGLFGSIEDLSAFALNVRSQLQGIAKYDIRQKTAQLFATRAVPADVGDWAMGYMMPSKANASCGSHFSEISIGHTGFTGTSFWYDPKNDLLVLILSNRVHYGRDNKAFIQLRPQIHSWIFESLKRTI